MLLLLASLGVFHLAESANFYAILPYFVQMRCNGTEYECRNSENCSEFGCGRRAGERYCDSWLKRSSSACDFGLEATVGGNMLIWTYQENSYDAPLEPGAAIVWLVDGSLEASLYDVDYTSNVMGRDQLTKLCLDRSVVDNREWTTRVLQNTVGSDCDMIVRTQRKQPVLAVLMAALNLGTNAPEKLSRISWNIISDGLADHLRSQRSEYSGKLERKLKFVIDSDNTCLVIHEYVPTF